MSSIYILSDHGKLGKKAETLELVQNDGASTIIFPYKTEHLIISGNISISGGAFRMLMRYGINTTFISTNGQFTGKLVFKNSKNVFLRQKQYSILDNPEKTLSIAKSIVTGKIRNEIAFMQRIKRKNETSNKLEGTIDETKQVLKKAENASKLEELRGYEGLAARKYFSVFSMNLIPEWAEFKTRSKNPPKSNVNAVLGFLYTLLLYRVESAVEMTGMDPMAGYLHALDYGNNALCFDLMEEYRTPIADSVCCSLFNLNILNEQDFEKKTFSEEDDNFPIEKADKSEPENNEDTGWGILLTKDGLRKVIEAFEKKMETVLYYQPLDTKIGYDKIIYEQAKHFKRIINGEEQVYQSLIFK